MPGYMVGVGKKKGKGESNIIIFELKQIKKHILSVSSMFQAETKQGSFPHRSKQAIAVLCPE